MTKDKKTALRQLAEAETQSHQKKKKKTKQKKTPSKVQQSTIGRDLKNTELFSKVRGVWVPSKASQIADPA